MNIKIMLAIMVLMVGESSYTAGPHDGKKDKKLHTAESAKQSQSLVQRAQVPFIWIWNQKGTLAAIAVVGIGCWLCGWKKGYASGQKTGFQSGQDNYPKTVKYNDALIAARKEGRDAQALEEKNSPLNRHCLVAVEEVGVGANGEPFRTGLFLCNHLRDKPHTHLLRKMGNGTYSELMHHHQSLPRVLKDIGKA